jgi:5S rRNA maturation endonuclease (ribonuclease M5)
MEKRNINLNSFVFNEQITRDDLFSAISQEDIYSFYIGEKIENGTKICSPLREDNVPSFSMFYHKHNRNILMFYDFATQDSGDAVIFVSKMFDLSYGDSIRRIVYDFKLSDVEVTAEKRQLYHSKKVLQKEQVQIGVKRREWKQHDAQFWKSFGITKATLEFYNVMPVSFIFFTGNPVKVEKWAYAYLEYKDNRISYKIYQPYAPRQYKWINNANYSVHQGYTQLPSNGDLLIITKSLKDVMSIRDVIGVPSVGLQSESVMMKDTVMDEYKQRFKKVVCLFDNDDAGKKLSQSFSDTYNIPHFFMPELKRVTDFSDLVKVVGKEKAKEEFFRRLNKV